MQQKSFRGGARPGPAEGSLQRSPTRRSWINGGGAGERGRGRVGKPEEEKGTREGGKEDMIVKGLQEQRKGKRKWGKRAMERGKERAGRKEDRRILISKSRRL